MSADQRLSVRDTDPGAYEAVRGLERYMRRTGMDTRLYELVKIRAAQLNGCAFCLDMHNVWNRLAVSTHQALPALD